MKKIVFITGTRADFGKLKSLIKITQESDAFEVHIFVTGMHMNARYGLTVQEVEKCEFKNIYKFINSDDINHMDRALARTIDGFSHYIHNSETKPHAIIVHGDRVETLAGAIVGSLNNILVMHIEGGEISGTIDELIRHSVSKMAHIHLAANTQAKNILLQLGEREDTIFIIGSPDIDLMNSTSLPSIKKAKEYYNILFENYAIATFHPVTTERQDIKKYIKDFVDALIESKQNYIIIYPNNDLGSDDILYEYQRLEGHKNFKIYPSLRFEFFLTFLKNAKFIIGNSSAGIREAPFYNIPSIDIGTRQQNRANLASIINTTYKKDDIINALNQISKIKVALQKPHKEYFGKGNSDKLFLDILKSDKVWQINHQKQFQKHNEKS